MADASHWRVGRRPALIVASAAVVVGAATIALLYRVPPLQAPPPAHQVPLPAPAAAGAAPVGSPPLTPAETKGPTPSPAAEAARSTQAGSLPPTPAETKGPTSGIEPPRFDIVRITPNGQAVVAGRAEPGSKVSIQDQGKPIGEAQADSQGNWVFIPPVPLPPGPRELTLTEHAPSGATVASKGSVLLVVPSAAAAPAPAMAVLSTPNAAPQVLQSPSPRTPGKLALDALDYGQGGDVQLGGTARAGTTVRVYVDNAPIGEAHTGADGTWSLTPQKPVAPGMHRLRLDQLGPTGKVIARVEVPFSREAVTTGALAAGSVVVQPGNSLWRFAREAYGSGVRYTVIYQANREEIRNPRLIYPGQVLSIPPAPQ